MQRLVSFTWHSENDSGHASGLVPMSAENDPRKNLAEMDASTLAMAKKSIGEHVIGVTETLYRSGCTHRLARPVKVGKLVGKSHPYPFPDYIPNVFGQKIQN